MTSRLTRGLGLALAIVLLATAGLLYPLTVPHAAHHAHHDAATHANALCAWLCAAGQGVESPMAPHRAPVTVARLALVLPFPSFVTVLPDLSVPRGPPLPL